VWSPVSLSFPCSYCERGGSDIPGKFAYAPPLRAWLLPPKRVSPPTEAISSSSLSSKQKYELNLSNNEYNCVSPTNDLR
jgi:hypothetical protein